jgi:transmembrane sensor
VEFGSTKRHVTLEDGEALFEVAKETQRPFVVEAGGSEVTALGTVFSVSVTPDGNRDTGMLAVTLVEGQVRVQTPRGRGTNSASAEQLAHPLVLLPGDRVRLTGFADSVSNREPTVYRDRPRIDQVLAWKRNEVMFDDVPLSEAVAEMNRYSRIPIVLGEGASMTKARVSGLFRPGDNLAFAHAIAELHGLVAREKEGRVELSRR